MSKFIVFITLVLSISSINAQDRMLYRNLQLQGQRDLVLGLASGMSGLVVAQTFGKREFEDYFPRVDWDLDGLSRISNKRMSYYNCLYAATFNTNLNPDSFFFGNSFYCSAYLTQMKFHMSVMNFPAYFTTLTMASASGCYNPESYFEAVAEETEACFQENYTR